MVMAIAIQTTPSLKFPCRTWESDCVDPALNITGHISLMPFHISKKALWSVDLCSSGNMRGIKITISL